MNFKSVRGLKNVLAGRSGRLSAGYLLIKDSSNAVITSITTPAPPIVLDTLKNGEYTAELRAVALTGQRSQASVIEFVISAAAKAYRCILVAISVK